MFTLKPIFSEIEASRLLIFASLKFLFLEFFDLNNLTRFSACLTDNFFSIILFAKIILLSNQTKIFA